MELLIISYIILVFVILTALFVLMSYHESSRERKSCAAKRLTQWAVLLLLVIFILWFPNDILGAKLKLLVVWMALLLFISLVFIE